MKACNSWGTRREIQPMFWKIRCSQNPYSIIVTVLPISATGSKLTWIYSWWVILPCRRVELNPADNPTQKVSTSTNCVKLEGTPVHCMNVKVKLWLQTCKDIFTKIDNTWCFADASSGNVEDPVKHIRMPIVHPDSAMQLSIISSISWGTLTTWSEHCSKSRCPSAPIYPNWE